MIDGAQAAEMFFDVDHLDEWWLRHGLPYFQMMGRQMGGTGCTPAPLHDQ
jgi:hypothetical protein